jgi:predicted secreted protein
LTLRLENTHGTGYKWQLDLRESKNTDLVAIDDLGWSAFEQPVGGIGGPGHLTFESGADAAGSVFLAFDYLRPREKKAPARQMSIEVTISEQ